MTTHTLHPDILTAGLADDCPRCQEHGDQPGALDDSNKARLVSGTLHTETDIRALAGLMAVWSGDYARGFRDGIRAGREQLKQDVGTDHLVDFAEDRWTVQHPLDCRLGGDMFQCAVHERVARTVQLVGRPVDEPGVYVVTIGPSDDLEFTGPRA